MYGISQNPDTKDYVIVCNDKYITQYFKEYCAKCDNLYANIHEKWCKPCQINNLKENNFTSKNKKIDSFIQKMQLKINKPSDTVFEFIPYNQFEIKDTLVKDNFPTVMYSAIWKGGPLYWNESNKKYARNLDKNVVLKCLYNSQNIIDLTNKV